MILFILINELKLVCFFRFTQKHFTSAKLFKHYPDTMVTLSPLRAKIVLTLSEYSKSHSVRVFSRGGCPVPPSPSYYNGGLQTYAIMFVKRVVIVSSTSF